MEPFYFGRSPTALFGAYQQPPSRVSRDTGVVLCYPMGQEYIRCHRAFLRLAVLLSSKGFHVLRFDYSGTGDSEGEFHDARIHQWVDDISTAVEELKGGCSASRICLIGLRLGASLSMIAGAQRGDVEGMVLWDPVVNGRAHVEHVTSLHEEWLRGSFARSRSHPDDVERREVLGFPLTDSMRQDMDGVDIMTIRRRPADTMLLITCSEKGNWVGLQAHLKGLGVRLQYEHVPGPEVWVKKDDDMASGLVPLQILERIASWVSEAFA